jgi:hypothetical protein
LCNGVSVEESSRRYLKPSQTQNVSCSHFSFQVSSLSPLPHFCFLLSQFLLFPSPFPPWSRGPVVPLSHRPISVFQLFSVSAFPWSCLLPSASPPPRPPIPGFSFQVSSLIPAPAFCFPNLSLSPAPAVLWSMVNSRWSPRPPRTLDFRLQTLDSSPSPRRLVGHSPERRRKPCQGESTSQPGQPLAELSILKGWQNPAQQPC